MKYNICHKCGDDCSNKKNFTTEELQIKLNNKIEKIKDITCDLCSGKGIVYYYNVSTKSFVFCHKCAGIGQLNWVEILFGKELILFEEQTQIRSCVLDVFRSIPLAERQNHYNVICKEKFFEWSNNKC